jgi:hypothetical protein
MTVSGFSRPLRSGQGTVLPKEPASPVVKHTTDGGAWVAKCPALAPYISATQFAAWRVGDLALRTGSFREASACSITGTGYGHARRPSPDSHDEVLTVPVTSHRTRVHSHRGIFGGLWLVVQRGQPCTPKTDAIYAGLASNLPRRSCSLVASTCSHALA